MEAYFINPVERRGRKKTEPHRRSNMAKRKKLYGAAAAAHAKKVGRRKVRRNRKDAPAPAPARKRRKASRKGVSRKRHVVHAYKARHHKRSWTSHARRKQWRVKQHISNPFGRPGQALVQGMVAAGIILGGLFVVGMVNRKLENIPAISEGMPNLAAKLALALAGAMGAAYAVKKGWLSQGNGVALAGVAFVPLALGGLHRVAPSIAGQISLSGTGDRGMDAELQDEGMSNVVSEGAINAELQAELQAEMQAELQADMDAEDAGSY